MEAPLTVALFDPGSPAVPRIELAANFDPHVMVRWDHRPAVAELDLAAITAGGKTLLDARAITALRSAGYVNLKAILAAGPDGLRAVHGLDRKIADELHAWAAARHAAQYALAELALEQPAPEVAPPPAPATPTTTTLPAEPPEADGEEVKG